MCCCFCIQSHWYSFLPLNGCFIFAPLFHDVGVFVSVRGYFYTRLLWLASERFQSNTRNYQLPFNLQFKIWFVYRMRAILLYLFFRLFGFITIWISSNSRAWSLKTQYESFNYPIHIIGNIGMFSAVFFSADQSNSKYLLRYICE